MKSKISILIAIGVVVILLSYLIVSNSKQNENQLTSDTTIDNIALTAPPSESSEPDIAQTALAAPLTADIPLPNFEDADPGGRALADALSGKTPRISDATSLWQKRIDDYITLLKTEDTAISLSRVHTKSEMIRTLGERSGGSAHSPSIIFDLALSRRFSKLITDLYPNGLGQTVDKKTIELLSQSVSQRLDQRREIDQLILDEINQWVGGPDEPIDYAKLDDNQRNRLIDLMSGYATTNYDTVSVPNSIEGESLGLVANVYLLGLSENADALPILLDLHRTNHSDLREDLEKRGLSPAINSTLVPEGMIADAIDRILIKQQASASANQGNDLLNQYKEWRSSTIKEDRTAMPIYTFSERMLPFDPIAKVSTIPKVDAVTTIGLPLTELVESDGHAQLSAEILKWAEQIHQLAK